MAEQKEFSTNVSFADLLEAGLHFGHQAKRWNPKMKRFVFAKRNGIYIIDLSKTLFHLKQALRFIHNTVLNGQHIVFVGTKRITQDIIKEAANRCGQHYVISRWLGGTLTNYSNIKTSIARMRKIESLEANGMMDDMPQKEASRLRSELASLQKYLSGISDMPEKPGALIVIDVNREAIAVREANRIGVPVVALVDTNCDPEPIDYPIPGNDDALRCVKLIINLFTDTIETAGTQHENLVAEQVKKAEQVRQEKEAKARKIDKKNKKIESDETSTVSASSAPSEQVAGKAEESGN